MGINGQMQVSEQLLGTTIQFFPANDAESTRLATQENIFAGAHFLYQRELLVNHGDSGLLRIADTAKTLFVSLDQNLSTVLRMRVNSTKDFHQCRFTGAVFPDQRMNLAPLKIESNTIERTNTGKDLRDVAHLQERRFISRHVALLDVGPWSTGLTMRKSSERFSIYHLSFLICHCWHRDPRGKVGVQSTDFSRALC